MSWEPTLTIGGLRPWPESVRVVRNRTDKYKEYVPKDRQECHEVVDRSVSWYMTVCSECGFTLAVEEYGPSNFCPQCGRRIVKEDK